MNNCRVCNKPGPLEPSHELICFMEKLNEEIIIVEDEEPSHANLQNKQ